MINPKELRIIFMGTPEFSADILKYILDKKYNIIAIVSQPDKPFGRGKKIKPTPVKKVALNHDIPIFQPDKMKDVYDKLESLNPDLIITAAFGKILRKRIIEMPKYGCWNIHTSLLPKYRGAAPMQRAIENGEEETGITIFKICRELDAGPIAYEEKINIEKNDNLENVYEKLLDISKTTIIKFIENINNIELKKQNDDKATYADKISKDELKLEFKDIQKTHNKIRAFDPFPGTYAYLNDKNVKLYSSKIYKENISGTPGKILGLDESDLLIETKNGILKIGKIQFPGKKPMTGKDAFNGNLINIGDTLK